MENAGPQGAAARPSRTESFHGFQCRAMTHRGDPRGRPAVRRRRPPGARGRPGRRRAARRQRLPRSPSSSARRSTTARTSTAARWRTARASSLEIVAAIRREVGADFHLQVKISAVDHNNAIFPWEKTRQHARGLDRDLPAGSRRPASDAIHVSSGSMFPHPRNPAGGLPVDVARETYDTMLVERAADVPQLPACRFGAAAPLFRLVWNRTDRGLDPRASTSPTPRRSSGASRSRCSAPAGSRPRRSSARRSTGGACDAVTIARPLIANNDLVKQFAAGRDRPRAAVHLLQPVPGERHREPARLLRAPRYDGEPRAR